MSKISASPTASFLSASAFVRYYALHQAAIAPFGGMGFSIGQCRRNDRLLPVIEEVIACTPFCRLLAFHTPILSPTRRLLCAPLAGHRSIQLRNMVEALLEDGDVYVTDWIDARDIPLAAGDFTLEENVRLLATFMTLVGMEGLDVLAICQATVPALAAISEIASHGLQEPTTLVLIGGPIDARVNPSRLARLATRLQPADFQQRFTGPVPSPYRGACRRVYPGFMQSAVLNCDQLGRHFGLAAELANALWHHPANASRIVHAMSAHYGCMMDIPAEFVMDVLRVVFREHLLPRGRWRVAGELVRPSALRTVKLLTVEGSLDTLTGRGQTHAAHALCGHLTPENHARLTLPGCTHYDLLGGERWERAFLPRLRKWLTEAHLRVDARNPHGTSAVVIKPDPTARTAIRSPRRAAGHSN